MEFIELNQIVDTGTDIELSVRDSEWPKVVSSITTSTGWLNKFEFNSLFSSYTNQVVFAFESFERISKSTGTKKRLTSSFELTWDNFDEFQKNTDILFLYLVSSKLSWVFYGNRDQWAFSARP